MANLDFTELDKWMTDLNNLQLDLHQTRASDDKTNQNAVNNNNSQPNNKSSVQYRYSAELVDATHQNTRTGYSTQRVDDSIQGNCYLPRTNLPHIQQAQHDSQLKKPQKTINFLNSTEARDTNNSQAIADIRNRKYQKHEYGIQSSKDNRSSYTLSCNNGSCIGRSVLENSVTNSNDINNFNYGLKNFKNKADYQTRTTSGKEQKSVHWSEDLDTSNSNRKQLTSDIATLNNNNKIIPTNFDSINTTIPTTTTNNIDSVTSNVNNNLVNSYGTGYPQFRRQQLSVRDVSNDNVTKAYSCSKNIEEFLRRRSLSSNPANASNQMIRSQSLYAYLSMRNESANNVAKTSANALANTTFSIKPDNSRNIVDVQPKLPLKQMAVTTSTTPNNNSNHRQSDNYSEYSIARRSVCSSVYGAESSISPNLSTELHLSSNRRSISPSFQRFSNQSETDGVVDKHQSNKTNLTVQIFLPDRTSIHIPVHSTTTTLQALQKLCSTNQKLLTMKHALVERIPVLHLERCLEDDEYLFNYLSSWKIGNENLIFLEERQDLYGLFESSKSWLGEHHSTFNINSNKNIFYRNENIPIPVHTDQLYLRIGQTKWKRRYCHLNSNGFYVSKQKIMNKSQLTRLNIFQPNLYLYITISDQNQTESPTPFGMVVRPHSTQQADSRLIIEMCAINEESWRKWYSLLRITLIGKRLYTNYIVRMDTVKIHRENFSHSDYSLRNSSRFNSLNDRPISSTVSELDSDHILGDLHSITPNYKTNSAKIEFPPKSGSYSVTDLTKPIQLDNHMINGRNQQSNEASSLTSLTLYPIQTPSQKSINRQSRLDKQNIKSVKKRIFGNGPSARRCTRSISHISSPFNISLPYWIRASYEDKMNETLNETVL
uniref:Putative growth factor receptor-bound protein n=1 Tax=Schistosoma mansoni TaxID=6183 RepID=A0A3Q0KQP4_SCHMA